MLSKLCVSYFVLAIIGVLATFVYGKQIVCTDALDGVLFPAEDDCDAYYLCAKGTLVLYNCPDGFSFMETACVPTALEQIECRAKRRAKRFRTQQIESGKPGCQPTETGLKVHPRKCSLYLDCDSKTFSNFHEEHTRECEYPELFDAVTLRCRHQSEVDCGKRSRPTDQCNYETNECLRGNCEPCELRMSSCAGLPDGSNAISATEHKPVYLLCSNGSILEHRQCPYKDVGRRAHRIQMFNAESGQCELSHAGEDGKKVGQPGAGKQGHGGNSRASEKPRDDGTLRGTDSILEKMKPRDGRKPYDAGKTKDESETKSLDKQKPLTMPSGKQRDNWKPRDKPQTRQKLNPRWN